MVEESYAYDPFGRLTSKTANDGTVQNYTYDNNSNVVTYTMTKDGETKNSIEYTYNTLNQLTKFNSDDMIYQYGYDKNGNLSWAYDAKLVNFNYEITYNKANLPKRIETTFDSKNYDYTLSYWLNGQKFMEQDTVNNVWTEYDYNSLGQLELELKQANNKTVCERGYTYDASGNRTQKRSWNTDAGKWDEITDYTYDANNRLTNEITKTNDDITSAVRYYYDENGNMTAEQSKVYTTEGTESSNMGLSGRIGGGSAKVYTYDRFNRLMQYNDGATEATYTYGADNLRASKTVNGTKTEFVWNGQNLASEITDDVMTIYNYDMTGVLGSKKDGEAEIRYHKDPHGNVLATEKNNALTGEYTYDAFGNQLTTAELDNPFRYCGEYFDNESGNIYLRNRYYSTATGRFITEDPIKDGVNWYSYCGGNPVMCFDPSGMWAASYTDEYGQEHGDPDYEEFYGTIAYQALSDLTESYLLCKTEEERQIVATLANEVRSIARRIGPSRLSDEGIIEQLSSKGLLGEYYSLSATEKVLIQGHPIKGMQALAQGYVAKDATRIQYGEESVWNVGGEADAFRHGMWNMLLTFSAGYEFALLWSNAHEFGTSLNLSDEPCGDTGTTYYQQTQMDLRNNNIAIYDAEHHNKKWYQNLYDYSVAAVNWRINNGDMMILN